MIGRLAYALWMWKNWKSWKRRKNENGFSHLTIQKKYIAYFQLILTENGNDNDNNNKNIEHKDKE